MTPQDASFDLPADDEQPLLPYLNFLDLSEEAFTRLQEILEKETGHAWRPIDAKLRGIELLELTVEFMDPGHRAYWQKHSPFAVTPVPVLEPLPIAQAFPIKLDADHDAEIRKALAMVDDELRHAKRRPTHWRWVIVALYDALGHALAKHRPASYLDDSRPGQLLRLFDAVAGEMPELPQVRASVEIVDRLRTTYLPRGVTRWPVELKALPGIIEDCERVIRRLEEDASTSSSATSSS